MRKNKNDEQDKATSLLPHLLDNNGYKVKICPTCKGWGKMSGVGWPEYNLFMETCMDCGGSGRIIKQIHIQQMRFNDLYNRIKEIDK